MSSRKIGVEEELLLVDPETGHLTAVSQAAVQANESEEEVAEELFLQQVETSTPPLVDADALRGAVRDGRRAVGEAAAAAGVRAVAVATPVLGDDEVVAVTPSPRYRRIKQEYGELARQALASAMHVHVEVADDEEGVRVLDAIRPWLPVLTAISANSPYWNGRDTDHASWRTQVWSRWPTAGVAAPFGNAASYREVTRQMVEWGGALDEGMLYFDARLSASFPTVEVRVADVCTDVEDALLVALLTRALVSTVAHRTAAPEWRADLLQVATWRASRHGLTGELVHPLEADLVPAREACVAVVDFVRLSLEESGDLELVTTSLDRLLAGGSGATRQRRVWERTNSLADVVDDLARRTEESWVP